MSTRVHRQLNETWKTIHEQNEKFNEKIELHKKKKRTEHILELKNTANELEFSIKSFNIRLNQAEERISKLKDMAFEIIQLEEQQQQKN